MLTVMGLVETNPESFGFILQAFSILLYEFCLNRVFDAH